MLILWCSGEIEWPSDDDEVADDAKQLILCLLDQDPSKRLGKILPDHFYLVLYCSVLTRMIH